MVAWFCAARSAPGLGARLDMAVRIYRQKADKDSVDRDSMCRRVLKYVVVSARKRQPKATCRAWPLWIF